MISDEDLEQLRYKGEGTDLDFKQAQYAFAGASDYEKSELLKDIMAIANAYRSGPGYILIGFKDLAPHPAEVVGISTSDHIDDAAIQQFVRSKIDPLLEFQYEERLFDGKHIAVITIPKQARPFVPKQDFGKLRKNVALVRRGSSTDEASMSEMLKMAHADAGSLKTARVELLIKTGENKPFPARLSLSFLRFGELPDYEKANWIDSGNGFRMPIPSFGTVNRRYYRELAEYYATMRRLVLVRLSLANQSDFALGEVKLELTCNVPSGENIQLRRSDELPEEPTSGGHYLGGRGFPSMIKQLRETVRVDTSAGEPICHVFLGTLRPGETGTAGTEIALLPTGPGVYTLRIRILAKEIAKPIVEEHTFTVDGEIKKSEFRDLLSLLFAKEIDETP